MAPARLPKLLVSSVVRGADQGDSHGGLYLVDLENDAFEQLLDWDDCGINFDGRGADRGLRGVVVHEELVYVAASDELFAFDRRFNKVASYKNPYLKHCHEICEHRGALYLTSTGFDSILRFDLADRMFNLGVQLARIGEGGDGYIARAYNPQTSAGPAPGVNFHLNNVYVDDNGIFTSGVRLPALVLITPRDVAVIADLTLGTHNAQPFQGGVLFNDTEQDRVVWLTHVKEHSISVPHYERDELTHLEADASGVARQAFARGLCPLSDRLVAGGSSPTTVSVYDLYAEERLKSFNITMDIRNAAHGMTVWPF